MASGFQSKNLDFAAMTLSQKSEILKHSLNNLCPHCGSHECRTGAGFGSLYAKLALSNLKITNPDWILVVIEIEKFPHPRFSWQLLAIDERERIRIFNPVFGFRLRDTQTTVFLGGDRTIVEHRTPEGIESVSFSEGGEV